jgi:hypothetical protein
MRALSTDLHREDFGVSTGALSGGPPVSLRTPSKPPVFSRRTLLSSALGGAAVSLSGCWSPNPGGHGVPVGVGPPKLMSDGLGATISDTILGKLLTTIRGQRPSLLNYGSPYFLSQPTDFPHPPRPPANGAPIATSIEGIKVSPNKSVPLVELAAQIDDIAVSFGTDKVGLPSSLLPLAPNALAARLSFSARTRTPQLDPMSLGFPDDADQFANAKFSYVLSKSFPIDLFIVLSCRLLAHGDTVWLAYSISGFASSLLQPAALAEAVNQIVVLLADTVLLPTAWAKIAGTKIDLAAVTGPSSAYRALSVMPRLSASTPNPTADADILSIFMNFEVKPA